MKILKYLIVFVLIIGIGFSTWVYYPQYQIQKMKKQTVNVNADSTKISYLDYFRNKDGTNLFHLAIGDSIIRGIGAKKNEDLVYQFSNKLGSQIQKEIAFQNEGINGITSSELNMLVQDGRFDEDIKKSDIITMNVGGNDILRAANGQDFYSAFEAFEQLQSNFTKNLSDMTERIYKINPNATIVFLELYNPLSTEDPLYSIADKLLPTWNLKIYEVAHKHSASLVVETTKVINGDNSQNLSADGVHPNSEGYMAISEQMLVQLKLQMREEKAV
jgi:lysophospholipase L1-like esterase